MRKKAKPPNAAKHLLPFKGTILWPLPGEIEPLEFVHPPRREEPKVKKTHKSPESPIKISCGIDDCDLCH